MAENLYQEALKKASDLHEKLGPAYSELSRQKVVRAISILKAFL